MISLMKFSLPKTIRLKKGWEFNQVFRTGFRIQGELVRLLCLKRVETETNRSEIQHSRVGFAVGKKQCNSCGRNRGKRILREAMRRLMPYVTPGLDIVATLKDTAVKSNTNAVDIYLDSAKILVKRGLLTKEWQQDKLRIENGELHETGWRQGAVGGAKQTFGPHPRTTRISAE
jgi:ribonuclease P protein component